MRRTLTLSVLLLSIALGACGTRGPLTLPPPVKTTAKPANSQPAPAPADLNTAKDPAQ